MSTAVDSGTAALVPRMSSESSSMMQRQLSYERKEIARGEVGSVLEESALASNESFARKQSLVGSPNPELVRSPSSKSPPVKAPFSHSLPPIPSSSPAPGGGGKYFVELYTASEKAAAKPEAETTVEHYIEACSMLTRRFMDPSTSSAKPLHLFRANDAAQQSLEVPMFMWAHTPSWIQRNRVLSDFVALALQKGSSVASAHFDHPSQRSAAGYDPIDDGMYVSQQDGLVVKLWRSAAQAHLLVAGAQVLWQSLFDCRSELVRTPLHLLMAVRGVLVSVLAASPICMPPPVHAPHGTVLRLCVDRLALSLGFEWGAAGKPPVYLAADGRYYCMLSSPAPVYQFKSPRGNNVMVSARPEARHCIPADTTTADNIRQWIVDTLAPQAAAALKGEMAAKGLTAWQALRDDLVTDTLHSHGVNMMFLFNVHQSPCLADGDDAKECRNALVLEMVFRTVKSVFRAEQLVTTTADEGGGGDGESQDAALERLNRIHQGCFQKKSRIWDDQIMPILRRKFCCPETFDVSVNPQILRVLISRFSALGFYYDSDGERRYTKCRSVPLAVPSFSLPSCLDGVYDSSETCFMRKLRGSMAEGRSLTKQSVAHFPRSAFEFNIASMSTSSSPASSPTTSSAQPTKLLRRDNFTANRVLSFIAREPQQHHQSSGGTTTAQHFAHRLNALCLAFLAGSIMDDDQIISAAFSEASTLINEDQKEICCPAEGKAAIASLVFDAAPPSRAAALQDLMDSFRCGAASVEDSFFMADRLAAVAYQSGDAAIMIEGLRYTAQSSWTHPALRGRLLQALLHVVSTTSALDCAVQFSALMRMGNMFCRTDTQGMAKPLLQIFREAAYSVVVASPTEESACTSLKATAVALTGTHEALLGVSAAETVFSVTASVAIALLSNLSTLDFDEQRQTVLKVQSSVKQMWAMSSTDLQLWVANNSSGYVSLGFLLGSATELLLDLEESSTARLSQRYSEAILQRAPLPLSISVTDATLKFRAVNRIARLIHQRRLRKRQRCELLSTLQRVRIEKAQELEFQIWSSQWEAACRLLVPHVCWQLWGTVIQFETAALSGKRDIRHEEEAERGSIASQLIAVMYYIEESTIRDWILQAQVQIYNDMIHVEGSMRNSISLKDDLQRFFVLSLNTKFNLADSVFRAHIEVDESTNYCGLCSVGICDEEALCRGHLLVVLEAAERASIGDAEGREKEVAAIASTIVSEIEQIVQQQQQEQPQEPEPQRQQEPQPPATDPAVSSSGLPDTDDTSLEEARVCLAAALVSTVVEQVQESTRELLQSLSPNPSSTPTPSQPHAKEEDDIEIAQPEDSTVACSVAAEESDMLAQFLQQHTGPLDGSAVADAQGCLFANNSDRDVAIAMPIAAEETFADFHYTASFLTALSEEQQQQQPSEAVAEGETTATVATDGERKTETNVEVLQSQLAEAEREKEALRNENALLREKLSQTMREDNDDGSVIRPDAPLVSTIDVPAVQQQGCDNYNRDETSAFFSPSTQRKRKLLSETLIRPKVMHVSGCDTPICFSDQVPPHPFESDEDTPDKRKILMLARSKRKTSVLSKLFSPARLRLIAKMKAVRQQQQHDTTTVTARSNTVHLPALQGEQPHALSPQSTSRSQSLIHPSPATKPSVHIPPLMLEHCQTYPVRSANNQQQQQQQQLNNHHYHPARRPGDLPPIRKPRW